MTVRAQVTTDTGRVVSPAAGSLSFHVSSSGYIPTTPGVTLTTARNGQTSCTLNYRGPPSDPFYEFPRFLLGDYVGGHGPVGWTSNVTPAGDCLARFDAPGATYIWMADNLIATAAFSGQPGYLPSPPVTTESTFETPFTESTTPTLSVTSTSPTLVVSVGVTGTVPFYELPVENGTLTVRCNSQTDPIFTNPRSLALGEMPVTIPVGCTSVTVTYSGATGPYGLTWASSANTFTVP